jgi:hypothetical protein
VLALSDAATNLARLCRLWPSLTSGNQVVNENNNRRDEQHVNQRTANMSNQSDQP